MSQILDPIPQNGKDSILCCYVNATSQIQIARITNIPNWYFERVVFPGQRLVFEAVPDALLEIHTGMMASAILSDTIPCERLYVKENNANRQSEKEKTETVAQKSDKKQKTETENKNHLNKVMPLEIVVNV
ncbi:DUF1830 domain-containing protein [Pleurocapsales cyanobacterium LEGE 06147]|nr:DUF1830 domain-containing protein [Pleurocapsales cyanobacterium LEGE 06147]